MRHPTLDWPVHNLTPNRRSNVVPRNTYTCSACDTLGTRYQRRTSAVPPNHTAHACLSFRASGKARSVYEYARTACCEAADRVLGVPGLAVLQRKVHTEGEHVRPRRADPLQHHAPARERPMSKESVARERGKRVRSTSETWCCASIPGTSKSK